MSMYLREARIDDLPQIQALMSELGYSQPLSQLEKTLQLYNESNEYGAAVADQKDIIVGLIAWSQRSLFVSPMTRIRIEGLVVSLDARCQGVASKLLRHVETYAQRHAPCIVEVTSGTRRKKDGVHDFYLKQGYNNEGRMEKLYLRKVIC